MAATKFTIRIEKGNRAGTIPPHWDIFQDGDDDSIATIWKSEELAQSLVDMLDFAANASEAELELAAKNES